MRLDLLECQACSTVLPEKEWNEVWSHKENGFIAFCCPVCKIVGKAKYKYG